MRTYQLAELERRYDLALDALAYGGTPCECILPDNFYRAYERLVERGEYPDTESAQDRWHAVIEEAGRDV